MITDPRCDLKLFIENTSCPIMSASISTAIRLTAQIEVLPTKEVRRLRPMTNVVVGYRDPAGKVPELVDQEGTTYSVLFIGMVSSIALSKSSTGRSATLACVGHQFLLDRHYTYVSNIATQSFSHKKSFVGAASFLRSELGAGGLAQQVASVFRDEAPPFTPGVQSLTGPPRGAIKLIEKCTGVTLPAGSVQEGHAHGAQHEFFAHASHQCRLLFQIDGVSVDEGLNSIIDRDSTGKVLSSATSQMSEHTDLSTMLDILLKQMYYAFTPIGAPRTYVSTDTEVVQRGSILTELREKYTSAAIPAGKPIPDTIGTPVVVAIKSAAETIYKDLGEGTSREAAALSRIKKQLKKDMSLIFPNLVSEIDRYVPSIRKDSFIDTCAPFINKLLGLRDSLKPLSEEDADSASRAVSAILRNLAAVAKVDNTSAGNSFCRVVSYMMMPDLTFCTPPTCNVIFPSQISTFNYNHEAFNMPTRLLLHSEMVANANENKGGFSGYYAPSSSEFAAEQGGLTAGEHEIPLLAHEKFTGIVPAFASISFYEKFKTLSGPSTTDNNMLRIANFNLMLQRYQMNGITCTGPFNPFVAVGYPIAFIDVDDINAESPSTYIGILSSVSHTYSGSGSASTTYTVRYVREAGDVDEIFGDAVMRTTNASGATPIVLTSDETTVKNHIKDALQQLLESTIEGKPVFLSTYEFQRYDEITLGGSKKSVRVIYQLPAVTSALEKAIPRELAGRPVVVGEWPGLEAYPPTLVHKNLISPIKNAETVVKILEKDPYVDNIHQSAVGALKNLQTYFTETASTKELAKMLSVVGTKPEWDAPFTAEHLNTVVAGRSLLQMLQHKIKASLKEGIHEKGKAYSVSSEIEVNWWVLMPIDSARLMDMLKQGQTEFFSRAYLFPKTALTEALAYLGAGPESAESVASEKIAVEELYRPPWFSDIFSIAKIGKDVYTHTLGCGSVQDSVPSEIDKDTSANTSEGAILTYTTRTSLLQAYMGYRNAPQGSKAEYVSSFVRRPIANVLDVIGENGLLTTRIADARVVDLSRMCDPTRTRDHAATDATTKSLTFAPDALVSEKRENVILYVNSTNGDAFR